MISSCSLLPASPLSLHHSAFPIPPSPLHHSPFIIHHSSFSIPHSASPSPSSFIIHHSAFPIPRFTTLPSSFIIHHSSFPIPPSPLLASLFPLHSSFIIHHSSLFTLPASCSPLHRLSVREDNAGIHPETPNETLAVSNSERRHFSSWQGNQGFTRRRT